MLNKYRIFKIKQVIESENKFINQYSKKKIFELAALKITQYIYRNFKKKKILFICGPGNNGKDGIYSNSLLKKKLNTTIYEISKESNNFSEEKFNELLEESDTIIDCIFGIGLNKNISNKYKKIIQFINYSKNKKIISIDLPSGIDGDSGKILGISIKAHTTLAMGVFKPAHFLHPSKDYCGKVELLDLNLPDVKNNSPQIFLLDKKFFENKFPTHPSNVHKYNKGHVLVVGGKMAGASRIVAYSARKTGCGLSSIIVNNKDLKFYSGTEPGTIIRSSSEKIDKKKVDCLVIGPGLGEEFSKNQFLNILKFFHCPIIIDADAFNIFKNSKKQFYEVLKKKKNIILTPHEGEFKRIFAKKQYTKISSCIEASKLILNNVVLKGNDTVVALKNRSVWINNNSSNLLATAGSGDMLCGIMSSLIAQKMEIKYSILASIYIHGQLSKQKNCSTVEDFIKKIPHTLRNIKK